MKILVQRCKEATVSIQDQVKGQIGPGLLLLVCLEHGDNQETVSLAVEKVRKLRIFEDDAQKMNLNISQINGSILSISQFTLSWDGKKGHRPSFEKSMAPNEAKILYASFNKKLREHVPVETGIFGEEMMVNLVNWGPVTFFLDF